MPFDRTSEHLHPHPWKLVGTAGAVAVLLGACSSDGSSSLPADDDSDVDIESAGRLALYDSEAAAVEVLDLDTGTALQRFALPGEEPRLYASPDRRYALAVQRDDGRVSFVDSGLYTEDHVEHLHDYAQDPTMLDFTLSGSRPTHYSDHEGVGAIFFDADEGMTSSVTVLSDADIGAARVLGELALDNNMHGAAKLVDDRLFVTYRDPAITATTLPAAIERHVLADGAFTLEQRYEEPCPLLHGHAANASFIVFGCGDGVLAVDLTREGYPATKLANPGSMAEDGRIGTVIAHPALDELVGVAGDQIFLIDPDADVDEAFREFYPDADRPIEELPLPGDVSRITQGFNVDGETFHVLGSDGMLHLYDVMADWAPVASVAVTAAIGEEGTAPIVVASGAEDRLFVLDTDGQAVIEVDGIDGTLLRTIDLGYTATRIAWLGLSDEQDSDD